ncbi:MAG: NAD(P)-binding domain-containing protein [Hyphomonas sp.]|nr:NAD(P)-binding domain-containing protein [Hyphomonas sp.]
MKISVLGVGNIGANLGKLFAQAGHEVFFASRNPDILATLVAEAGANAQAGTIDDAIAFSDLIVEALPFAASMALSPTDLVGKTLITASNYYPQRDGTIDLGGLSESEALAKRLPDTKIVKAFNMLYFKELEDRLTGDGTPNTAMMMAGDDADTKVITATLITDAKFDVVDAGPLSAGAAFQAGAPLYAKTQSRAEIESQLADL